ncbi:sulfite exporter TauE/SafE family protein [Geoalkalibacter halelectricus]|uniref:Sulfite exporter TauE/SafE family protein n=1 Tax=Geoalkalibacter halelectricus TaxID=2847045 RepID=A0ABY5ZNU2_9BACT|nr:sulfite exporter TauE/SafE family protein [Geoalkalibacter halelectricus]MDO3377507.1 sulfite exporter TauE/SafE family protein [Geoalkalibacter halelectricus]UWZ80733.1 sulfite exporter TauE/SafE family protein [Geoalkalibacter halelectricus]
MASCCPTDLVTTGPLLLGMALATGLLGSGHCIGMCGGIIAALSLSVRQGGAGIWFQLAYHLGRLTTYGAMGAVLGWLGAMVVYTEGFQAAARMILIGADLLLIAAGLATAGLAGRRSPLELEWAAPRRLIGCALTRLRRWPVGLAALPLGLVFGLLPCGLLYAVALAATQSADPGRGALLMLAFGLGTVPALLLVGSAAAWLGRRGRRWMMRAAGVIVALMGFYQLVRHLGLLTPG